MELSYAKISDTVYTHCTSEIAMLLEITCELELQMFDIQEHYYED